MNGKRLIQKTDFLLILGIILIAFFLYFPKLLDKGGISAHIYIENMEYQVIDLSRLTEEQFIDLPTDPFLVLRAGPGYIRVHSAGCPDRLCAAAGTLTKNGDMAVCVPARVVVKVVSAGHEDTFDAIAY
ncbi:MAG: NusG domain II-containing protein [Oscillospiraceae bacterium]|nr:NusG domain II-containing protein [Oscillospiraceae bacterium]